MQEKSATFTSTVNYTKLSFIDFYSKMSWIPIMRIVYKKFIRNYFIYKSKVSINFGQEVSTHFEPKITQEKPGIFINILNSLRISSKLFRAKQC